MRRRWLLKETLNKIFSDYPKNLVGLGIEYENTDRDLHDVDEYLMAHEVLCDGFERMLNNPREVINNEDDVLEIPEYDDDTDDDGYSSDEIEPIPEYY